MARSETLAALHAVGREVKFLLLQQTGAGVSYPGDPATGTLNALAQFWQASDAKHEPTPKERLDPMPEAWYRNRVRGIAAQVDVLLAEVEPAERKDPLVAAARAFLAAERQDP